MSVLRNQTNNRVVTLQKDREELFAKIEDLKKEIIGTSDS